MPHKNGKKVEHFKVKNWGLKLECNPKMLAQKIKLEIKVKSLLALTYANIIQLEFFFKYLNSSLLIMVRLLYIFNLLTW